MKKFLSILIPVFLTEIIANSAWIAVSYDQRIRCNTLYSYTIATIAGTLSGMAWCYMARHTEQSQMFFANIAWDFLVSCIFILLPIFYYGVKLDSQTTTGTVIAFIGLLIMHH